MVSRRPGASRYVAGRSRTEALRTSAGLLQQRHGVSVDLFGELVDDRAEAEQVVQSYQSLARRCPSRQPMHGYRWT